MADSEWLMAYNNIVVGSISAVSFLSIFSFLSFLSLLSNFPFHNL